MNVTPESGTVEVITDQGSVSRSPPQSVEVAGDSGGVEVQSTGSVVSVDPGPVQVIAAGQMGPQGPVGPQGLDGSGWISKRFDWGDATPKLVATIAAGRTVLRAVVYLIEGFDGSGSSLSLGTVGDPSELLSAGDVSSVGSVSSTPSVEYAADTPIYLTISLGTGNTKGSGYVSIQVNNEVSP